MRKVKYFVEIFFKKKNIKNDSQTLYTWDDEEKLFNADIILTPPEKSLQHIQTKSYSM